MNVVQPAKSTDDSTCYSNRNDWFGQKIVSNSKGRFSGQYYIILHMYYHSMHQGGYSPDTACCCSSECDVTRPSVTSSSSLTSSWSSSCLWSRRSTSCSRSILSLSSRSTSTLVTSRMLGVSASPSIAPAQPRPPTRQSSLSVHSTVVRTVSRP